MAWQVVQSDWLRLTTRPERGGRFLSFPDFIKTRAEQFLGCGLHSSGFARVRCGTCQDSMLVPFSCKVRGLCSSCDGKRMAQQAAYLLDEVLPKVHYRQWVFTLHHNQATEGGQGTCRLVLRLQLYRVDGGDSTPLPGSRAGRAAQPAPNTGQEKRLGRRHGLGV